MNNLTLIKKSPCVQLGHLYEHLYCHELISYLFDKDVFEYVDYDLIAHTYHGGIVYIDISFYSEKARSYVSEFTHIKIPISDNIIHRGFSQIESEIQEILSYTSFKDIANGLHQLQDEPWQFIDDIDRIDTKDIRRKTKPFYIAEGKFPQTKKMIVNITLDSDFFKEQRHLLPLFRELSLIAGKNIQNTIANSLSIYSKNDTFINNASQICYRTTFTTYPEFDIDLYDIIEDTQGDVRHIIAGGGFNRLIEQLQNLNYRDDTHSVPNIHTLYKDTVQIIGSKGWQKIATKENLELLLQHTSVEVKFGRHKTSSPLLP